MKKIKINNRVFGNIFEPSAPKKLQFLLIHGWQGRQNLKLAQVLCDQGFRCLTFEMRGHGESKGNISKLTSNDFLGDVLAAYNVLQKKKLPIGVIGSSFGAYLAVLLSAKRSVVCLSLRVPANYPNESFVKPKIMAWGVKAWRKKSLTLSDNMALQALHQFTGNVQLIEAENDEIVPHQTIANYLTVVNAKKLEYHCMKSAPHSLTNQKLNKEYQALVITWAKKQF